jgi:hypothetical protein
MVPERPPARANPARGLALIATAVILAVFVLRQGWDDSAPAVATGTGEQTTEETPGEPSEQASGDQAPPETQPVRPPGEVTVQVLNSSGVSGAACGLTNTVTEAGYQASEATDAPAGTPPEATIVFFAAGFENEAGQLASQVNAPPDAVAALNDPPQYGDGSAQLVVILGADLAESYAPSC